MIRIGSLFSGYGGRLDLGKDPVYLTRFGVPLDLAVAEAQDMLPGFGPDMETCDEGYCWT